MQAPAQSAVLIGVHLHESTSHPSTYRTYLITLRDGKARLAAEIPDLIVPRKDGFWRVGALHKGPACCGGYQEFLYAAPVRSVPHAIGEYHPENPETHCSQTKKATIEFVNPDLLSLSYFDEPACSLEVEYGHGTYRLDGVPRKLEISAVLGPTAWIAEKKADTAAKSNHKFTDVSLCEGVSRTDPFNWGIESARRFTRSKAKPWILVGDYNSPHVCGDGHSFEIEFPIPESIAGRAYPSDTLQLLLKFKPDLGSEFNIVMVQWAVGRHVADWESELESLQSVRFSEAEIPIGKRQP